MRARPATAALPLLAVLAGHGAASATLASAEDPARLPTPAGAVVVSGDSIPAPLTAAAADAGRGRLVFLDRDRGHCLLCHAVAELDEPFQGTIGPALTGVGGRLTAGQLRLRLVDASYLNPSTIMPPYFRTAGLRDVQADFRDTPVLSAQEVEDVIAYLGALEGSRD